MKILVAGGSGFEPKVSFEEDIKKLVLWSQGIKVKDLTKKTQSELKKRDLV